MLIIGGGLLLLLLYYTLYYYHIVIEQMCTGNAYICAVINLVTCYSVCTICTTIIHTIVYCLRIEYYRIIYKFYGFKNLIIILVILVEGKSKVYVHVAA